MTVDMSQLDARIAELKAVHDEQMQTIAESQRRLDAKLRVVVICNQCNATLKKAQADLRPEWKIDAPRSSCDVCGSLIRKKQVSVWKLPDAVHLLRVIATQAKRNA